MQEEKVYCQNCQMWQELDRMMIKNTPQGLRQFRIHFGLCLAFVTFTPIELAPGGMQALAMTQCGPRFGCIHFKERIDELVQKKENGN